MNIIERARLDVTLATARRARSRDVLRRAIVLLRLAEADLEAALLRPARSEADRSARALKAKGSYDDALALVRLARELDQSTRRAVRIAQAHVELCLSRERHEQASRST